MKLFNFDKNRKCRGLDHRFQVKPTNPIALDCTVVAKLPKKESAIAHFALRPVWTWSANTLVLSSSFTFFIPIQK